MQHERKNLFIWPQSTEEDENFELLHLRMAKEQITAAEMQHTVNYGFAFTYQF
jgi:hypothetical protein